MDPGEHNQKCEILLPWEALTWIRFMGVSSYILVSFPSRPVCRQRWLTSLSSSFPRYIVSVGLLIFDQNKVDRELPFYEESCSEKVTVKDRSVTMSRTVSCVISRFVPHRVVMFKANSPCMRNRWWVLVIILRHVIVYFCFWHNMFLYAVILFKFLFSIMLLRIHIKWLREIK